MLRAVKTMIIFASLVVMMGYSTGCAGFGKRLKDFMAGKTPSPEEVKRAKVGPTFSQESSMRFSGQERQYRRMNRQKFEQEAEVSSDAGSLWVMEGQGAYLFAENTSRIVGDLLNVKIDGAPLNQLNAKVRVISKLLERLERSEVSRGLAAAQTNRAQPAADPKNAQDKAAGQQAAQQPQPTPAAAVAPQAPVEPTLSVDMVPTRIVEKLRDGNYRVKGSETFMIGRREYKVIVTGVVRSEDFNGDGLSAGRLLDPQFDIISSRKGSVGL